MKNRSKSAADSFLLYSLLMTMDLLSVDFVLDLVCEFLQIRDLLCLLRTSKQFNCAFRSGTRPLRVLFAEFIRRDDSSSSSSNNYGKAEASCRFGTSSEALSRFASYVQLRCAILKWRHMVREITAKEVNHICFQLKELADTYQLHCVEISAFELWYNLPQSPSRYWGRSEIWSNLGGAEHRQYIASLIPRVRRLLLNDHFPKNHRGLIPLILKFGRYGIDKGWCPRMIEHNDNLISYSDGEPKVLAAFNDIWTNRDTILYVDLCHTDEVIVASLKKLLTENDMFDGSKVQPGSYYCSNPMPIESYEGVWLSYPCVSKKAIAARSIRTHLGIGGADFHWSRHNNDRFCVSNVEIDSQNWGEHEPALAEINGLDGLLEGVKWMYGGAKRHNGNLSEGIGRDPDGMIVYNFTSASTIERCKDLWRNVVALGKTDPSLARAARRQRCIHRMEDAVSAAYMRVVTHWSMPSYCYGPDAHVDKQTHSQAPYSGLLLALLACRLSGLLQETVFADCSVEVCRVHNAWTDDDWRIPNMVGSKVIPKFISLDTSAPECKSAAVIHFATI